MTLMRPAILAIDDNPQNLVMLATALEAEFDFELASSGEEGIRSGPAASTRAHPARRDDARSGWV